MKVQIDSASEIIKKTGLDPYGPIQSFFTNECYRRMDKYVPMSDLDSRGDLRTIVYIDSDSITYEVPYASYQYYGMRADGTHRINPEHYTTPGTGPYWDRKMMSAEKEQLIQSVKNEMKRGR